MTQKTKQLIVFIKAPQPGQCKTRLIPLLGAQKACEFYQSLVINCFEKLHPLENIRLSIYAYPDTDNELVQKLARQYPCKLNSQQGNNLGERMYHAMQNELQKNSSVVLIGTDCPVIDKHYVESAFYALESPAEINQNQHNLVFGPATDGGYVLIGANSISPVVFQNIDWSTDKVLRQSLLQAKTLGYNVKQLEALWDIDTPEDYLKYQSYVS